MPAAAWQMPQGGIDPPETPLEAARREMLEEIGTDRAELLRESRHLALLRPAAAIAREQVARPLRGQTQKWLAFRFTGDDADIRLDTAHPEFSAWRWAAAGDAARPDRAVQARGLSQRRRRVPSPMGLTMMVDGIGRGARRSSAGGSSSAHGGAGGTAAGGGGGVGCRRGWWRGWRAPAAARAPASGCRCDRGRPARWAALRPGRGSGMRRPRAAARRRRRSRGSPSPAAARPGASRPHSRIAGSAITCST